MWLLLHGFVHHRSYTIQALHNKKYTIDSNDHKGISPSEAHNFVSYRNKLDVQEESINKS